MKRFRLRMVLLLGVCCLSGCLTPQSNREDTEKNKPSEPKTNLTFHLGSGVAMEFILIPAGSFQMGSEQNDSEKPVHQVTITKPFYMGKYMVTQEQWEKVMGGNPSHFKGVKKPVDMVSWEDCQKFMAKLNEKLSVQVFRLPSEAEWEYACRAGTTNDYSFGDNKALLGEYAWYGANAEHSGINPVGEKKPNPWGLYDMHGNVWEWCADWNGSYPSGDQTDPVGPSAGAFRVLRGGSWRCGPEILRSSYRDYGVPVARYDVGGLRCALAAVPTISALATALSPVAILTKTNDKWATAGRNPDQSQGRKDKGEPQLRLELHLVDGTHFIGTPSIEAVPVQTSYTKRNIPLRQIRTIRIDNNHETAMFDLIGGDKLTGVITMAPIKLDTPIGKVAVGIEHIRELRVVLSDEPLPKH